MCQAAIRIVSRSLDSVGNAKLVLTVKDDIALFIQTMEVCGTIQTWNEPLRL